MKDQIGGVLSSELEIFLSKNLIFSSCSSTKSCSSATGSSRLKICQNRIIFTHKVFFDRILGQNCCFEMDFPRKTFPPKKYLWKWSRIPLNVATLKKKGGGEGLQYVWAHQLHPWDLIDWAVFLKRFIWKMWLLFFCHKLYLHQKNSIAAQKTGGIEKYILTSVSKCQILKSGNGSGLSADWSETQCSVWLWGSDHRTNQVLSANTFRHTKSLQG